MLVHVHAGSNLSSAQSLKGGETATGYNQFIAIYIKSLPKYTNDYKSGDVYVPKPQISINTGVSPFKSRGRKAAYCVTKAFVVLRLDLRTLGPWQRLNSCRCIHCSSVNMFSNQSSRSDSQGSSNSGSGSGSSSGGYDVTSTGTNSQVSTSTDPPDQLLIIRALTIVLVTMDLELPIPIAIIIAIVGLRIGCHLV